jgi:MFS-type transporter involved in bile tolerance (Atg22 family)
MSSSEFPPIWIRSSSVIFPQCFRIFGLRIVHLIFILSCVIDKSNLRDRTANQVCLVGSAWLTFFMVQETQHILLLLVGLEYTSEQSQDRQQDDRP